MPGFEIAARYVPSGNGEIGGDWYDVFPLPSGAVCIVIGDVVGRGLEAAIAMNRLRCAVRAYAMDAEDPAELLGRVDRMVAHFEPDLMATVLCAVLNLSGDELRLSSAGHPPPVISVADGVPAAVFELPHDLPIGVDARRRRRASTMTLPAWAVLCLYTDGLVERRGTPLGAGIERLRDAVFAGGAESLCAGVMTTMVEPEPMSDDVAVLVVRRLAAQLAPLDMQMPAAMSSLGPLRQAARRWLTDVGADATEAADLLVAIGEWPGDRVARRQAAVSPRRSPLRDRSSGWRRGTRHFGTGEPTAYKGCGAPQSPTGTIPRDRWSPLALRRAWQGRAARPAARQRQHDPGLRVRAGSSTRPPRSIASSSSTGRDMATAGARAARSGPRKRRPT